MVVAVRCAIEVQDSVEHNAGPPPERRTSSRRHSFRDVVEESDGDLMGDGSTSSHGSTALQPGRGLPTPATPLDCGAAIRQRGHHPEQELFVDELQRA